MNNEILAILDYLERTRGLDRATIVQVIEESLLAAARKTFTRSENLRVALDPRSGDIRALCDMVVAERVSDAEKQIDLATAQTRQPTAKLGDLLPWEVTPKDFGRIAAQTAKQGIMQRLRTAEKEHVRDEYRERIGDILYGRILRFEKGDIVVSFDRAEGLLGYQDRVPSEDYQVGDHISVILRGIDIERPGPVLTISRSVPELVKRLFEREVTEIAEGIVEIKAVAREPGFRSKIAVHSSDAKVDPVGACVGMRGSRVKTIVRELNGEKVDIIRWAPDVKSFVREALRPAEIKSLTVDEKNKQVSIIVEADQLSLAIGKRGQNARLAHKLTGWRIDIQKAEEQEHELTLEEKMQRAAERLAAYPGIEKGIAEKLVSNGFLSAEGIRAADLADLAAIEGFDPEIARTVKEAVGEE